VFDKTQFEYKRDRFGNIIIDPSVLKETENMNLDYEEYCKCLEGKSKKEKAPSTTDLHDMANSDDVLLAENKKKKRPQ
jgi:hypothetical protein